MSVKKSSTTPPLGTATVYKAVAAHDIVRGEVALPDGITYPVCALTIGQEITLLEANSDAADVAVMLPVYIELTAALTGAPEAVIRQLDAKTLAYIIAIGQHGVVPVMDAIGKMTARVR